MSEMEKPIVDLTRETDEETLLQLTNLVFLPKPGKFPIFIF